MFIKPSNKNLFRIARSCWAIFSISQSTHYTYRCYRNFFFFHECIARLPKILVSIPILSLFSKIAYYFRSYKHAVFVTFKTNLALSIKPCDSTFNSINVRYRKPVRYRSQFPLVSILAGFCLRVFRPPKSRLCHYLFPSRNFQWCKNCRKGGVSSSIKSFSPWKWTMIASK